ncbi:hypothetical protein [Vibrio sp. LaRot3]|uniref:hypothetical protein n=1 Tax=Vibrio sp. LaRot3 TaxID=2998829 RepID=UPI0022CE1323|nr:hypothetical protein [Vibrio sp. LaRot3]MDA0150446.1 hypothetical protein [Vibrio sp. LaRot3]
MLTTLDRLSIYSVLCFIALCTLVTRSSTEGSLMPLVGVAATIVGIWLEIRQWQESSSKEC